MAWYKQKTTWTGVAGIATGVGLIISGDVSTGIQTALVGLMAIFGRQAVNKVAK